MTTEIMVRGNVLIFTASFADINGDPVIPDSVTAYLNFRASEADPTLRDQDTIDLDADSDGVFTGEWPSGQAAAGRLFWSVRATNPEAAEDGILELKANPANPDPGST